MYILPNMFVNLWSGGVFLIKNAVLNHHVFLCRHLRMEDRRKAVGGTKIETVWVFSFFFFNLKIPASIGCRYFTCIMNWQSFQLAQPHPLGKSEGGYAAPHRTKSTTVAQLLVKRCGGIPSAV